mmetsp:Transcript_107917/g.232455  ORF Transcript_107917/g.232455 Transcript_107917/m.232455 type:complete len:395 (+) Transcript_107917:1765-2949(+)
MRRVDCLRLGATLPSLLALSASRELGEAAQQVLQASLSAALEQGLSLREPLVDLCVASFIHFLSHLDLFEEEAAAAASAYPQSGRIAGFFVEALVRCAHGRAPELLRAAMRVVDCTRHFVDRDRPDSDALHKAASVLRHVIEKKCPEIGPLAVVFDQNSAVCMPAEMFMQHPHSTASSWQAQSPIQSGAGSLTPQASAAITAGELPAASWSPPPGQPQSGASTSGSSAASPRFAITAPHPPSLLSPTSAAAAASAAATPAGPTPRGSASGDVLPRLFSSLGRHRSPPIAAVAAAASALDATSPQRTEALSPWSPAVSEGAAGPASMETPARLAAKRRRGVTPPGQTPPHKRCSARDLSALAALYSDPGAEGAPLAKRQRGGKGARAKAQGRPLA